MSNNTVFDYCIEDMATAIHADILLFQAIEQVPPWTNTASHFLPIALEALSKYRTRPFTPSERVDFLAAMCDAERRILFGFQQPRMDSIRQHLFLREQLTHAFSATKERKGLFDGGVLSPILKDEDEPNPQ